MWQTKYFNTTIHFWRSWFLSINFVEVVTASGVCEELPKPSSTEEEDSNNVLCAGRVGAAPRLCCWRWRGSERRGSAWRLEASRVLRVVLLWCWVFLGRLAGWRPLSAAKNTEEFCPVRQKNKSGIMLDTTVQLYIVGIIWGKVPVINIIH